ncbi:hypothetical protein [Paraburkholderia oxyphila]|uniref:hypothetical protein n=1 Tax=Paraburkholderia oxyphila TaxID=614212 RepID=UPI000489AC6F|nr:hypothetical protein [Paraburkholderia oxyphila]
MDVDHIEALFDIGECSRLREQIVMRDRIEHARSVVSGISCFTHAPSLADPKISDVDLNVVMPQFLNCVMR